MLFIITSLVDFAAMAITLWLGLYLLGRSFPHPIALRAVVMLLAFSVFFFGAFSNLYHQYVGMAVWRAIMVIIGFGTWYSLISQLMSSKKQADFSRLEIGIYLLGAVAIILMLVSPNVFTNEGGNYLYVAHMNLGWPYIIWTIFQILVSYSLLSKLLSGEKIGLTSHGRYFLLASIFGILAAVYLTVGLISPIPVPRLGQDLFTFCGIFLVGLAVARHQAMVERRVSLPDFPVNGVTVLGISGVYAFLGWRFGLDPEVVAFVMYFAIFTHALTDYARDFLDRLRLRQDNTFRKKLYRLENEQSERQNLYLRMKISLGLLIHTLIASGGFVAMRRDEGFEVIASQNSISPGNFLLPGFVQVEEVTRLDGELNGVTLIAPVIENQIQVAVIGLGKPRLRLDYSEDDLDLLAEVADRIGAIILMNTLKVAHSNRPEKSDAGASLEEAAYNSKVDELVLSIAENPDAGFVKIVEDSLRRLLDYNRLGESALASQLGIVGNSHVERGKILYTLLLESIESLHPVGARPKGALPRIWFNCVVLYDAYVASIPNREIMARLYISEGTFNRTRRNALRSLARLLLEK